MHKYLAILISVLVSVPAYSAGLGPLFENKSPTSTVPAPKPSAPVSSPAATPKPASAPAAPPNQAQSPANNSNSQTKK